MEISSTITTLAVLLTLCVSSHGYLTSGVSVVYTNDNDSITTGSNVAYYDVDYLVSSSSIEPSNINTSNYVPYLITASGQEVNVLSYSVAAGPINNQSLLKFEQTVEQFDTSASPDIVKFNLLVTNYGNDDAYGAYVNIDLTTGMDVDYGSISVNTTEFAEITNKVSKRSFTWSFGNLSAGDSRYLTFTVEPAGASGTDMQQTTLISSALYYLTVYQGSDYLGPINAEVALIRGDSYTTSLFYQHGFTALTFFLSFLLGMGLVILGIVIFMIIRRRQQRSTGPAGINEKQIMREKSTMLMMDADIAMRKGGHTIIDYSSMEEDESIVGVLSNKDRLQRFREIDGLDIVSTVKTDVGIEQQRNESSTNAMVLLIQGLKHNKDITPAVEEAVINNFKKKKMLLDHDMDEEYKREMKKLYKKLSAKNKAIMSRKIQKHREAKKQLVSESGHLGDKETKDLLDLMNQQHQTELNEETYRLKLEQDEEAENLRKEFAIRKRMGLKEIEQGVLDDLQEQGNLNHEKADWLLKEHKNTQNKLEKMYDEEISRQRMLLEEKLERRKALAKASEQQEDDHSDLLNTIAGQQVGLVQRAKKQGAVDDATADELIDKAKQEMITLKEKLDKDKERQEAELQKKLSNLKKQRLTERRKQHEADLLAYEKQNQAQQTDGPLDPVSYMEGKLNLQSQQRRELYDLENEIDEDQADELRNIREDMVEQTKEQLHVKEDQLVKRLQEEGMPEDKMRTLLKQHENQVKKLQDDQKRVRDEQERQLREKLSKNRQEWARRKEAEKAEQQQLREHEDKIISKLISGQMSMSEDERDRILKEHEKQMVKLENSLTLNKLRQKRMLEEKLANKRSQQMMLLQQKHTKESEKMRRTQENNGEESDEESQRDRLNLMKRQAEQRMAILQGNKLDLDDEMESVRIEMLKQRALALRDQEERLGAMVATLQVSKAREMAKIEEQQKAITNLKANLMDDLNARGILSDPECEAILKRHKEAQEDLNKRIEGQRSKQEKMLKQRLKERLDQREKSMLEAQDIELHRIMGTTKNKTAIKIKKVLLIHKHMVEMEKFRNRLDREVAQVLEDVKQQYEVKRLRALQEQELEFVAGLIRVGAFNQEEVTGVLHVLFPTKTDKQLTEIMAKIYDPKDQQKHGEEHGSSTLIERVQDTKLNLNHSFKRSPNSSLRSTSPQGNFRTPAPAPVKRQRKKKQEPAIPVYSDDDETVMQAQNDYSYLDARPDPIGEVVQAQPMEDFNYMTGPSEKSSYLKPLGKTSQPQPSRLPPLEPIQSEATTGKKKKKGKLLKKLAHEPQKQSYYDDELL